MHPKDRGIILKIVLCTLTILIFSSTVFAGTSPQDKTQIQDQVILIANSVNNNDVDAILNILSKNARLELRNEIETNLRGKTIKFQQEINSYEDFGDNKVKVKGVFAAEGLNWNVKGFSNYFIFERVNGQWLLFDTNFHQKMSSKGMLTVMVIMFAIFIPLFLAFFGFWLWMLIDCIKKQFEDKVLWIILIAILGLLGAVLYFFLVKRKLKQKT